MQYNYDAEIAILGALVLRPKIIPKISLKVNSDWFYFTDNKLLFKLLTVEKILTEDMAAPVPIMHEALKNAGAKKTEQMILDIVDVATSAGIDRHIEIIKELWQKREIKTLTNTVLDNMLSPSEEIVSEIKAAVKKIEMDFDEKDYLNPQELTNALFDLIVERSEGNKEIGYLTGFKEIDEHVHGLAKSETYFIKAPSKTGKSAFVLNMMDYVLQNNTGVVLYFTHESTAKYLQARRLSKFAKIPLTRILTGNVNNQDLEIIKETNELLYNSNMHIFDKSKFSNFNNMRAKCETFAMDHKILCIVNDYMGLLKLPGQHQSRHIELSRMTNAFNYLAKDLNCPVVTISQVNDDGKAKESRDIEDNADNVWSLSRGVMVKNNSTFDVIEVEGQKGKNVGSFDKKSLIFNSNIMTFTNI